MIHDKVALVTGAGSGLGAALAEMLAWDGYDVALHYHKSRPGAEATADRIHRVGHRATTIRGDLSNEIDAINLALEVVYTFGRLDLLINNAGSYQARDLDHITAAEWDRGLHSTATAAFHTTRACLPLLRNAPAGRIINIGDSSCDRPGARDLAVGYHIGKTGVWTLTRSFARAEAPHGITVNMISPGYLQNSIDAPEPHDLPAGRIGTFDDIHQAVRFLSSADSAYLTGSNLVVSGGWNLR